MHRWLRTSRLPEATRMIRWRSGLDHLDSLGGPLAQNRRPVPDVEREQTSHVEVRARRGERVENLGVRVLVAEDGEHHQDGVECRVEANLPDVAGDELGVPARTAVRRLSVVRSRSCRLTDRPRPRRAPAGRARARASPCRSRGRESGGRRGRRPCAGRPGAGRTRSRSPCSRTGRRMPPRRPGRTSSLTAEPPRAPPRPGRSAPR